MRALKKCRQNTVPNSRSITLKLLPKKTKPIFSTLDTYWTCPHPLILWTSLALGGTAIIFSQNWNFELKFVLVNSLVKKIGSMGFLNPLKPKNVSKTARNCQSAATSFFSQIWNFKLKIFLVDPLMKKIGSMWFLSPLKPQNKSKMAKNCQSAATVIDSFWQFLTHFWALKDLKTT